MASPSLTHILLVIAVVGLATFATRIVPFLAFGKANLDDRLRYIGTYLPLMITVILVVYSFKDVRWQESSAVASNLAGALVTLLVQVRFRNALASIAAGVGVYALVLRLV